MEWGYNAYKANKGEKYIIARIIWLMNHNSSIHLARAAQRQCKIALKVTDGLIL